MSCSAFTVATGTGYCVNGVAGTSFAYGAGISYSNIVGPPAVPYNVKVKNTVSTFAVTVAFTPSV
jgi:hypothetical protein